MAFTWSVWPFLSSLTVAFSICQSSFHNHEGWRGKGKSEQEHYLAKDSRSNFTASSSRGAQLQSPAELALLWKYTKPAAAREQKTCFCLCPCACYSSHRHPSSVGCEQGTAHHKGHLPAAPPWSNSKPAQIRWEMHLYWDTKGNGFPQISVSWHSSDGTSPQPHWCSCCIIFIKSCIRCLLSCISARQI